jgi:hypothetical protein
MTLLQIRIHDFAFSQRDAPEFCLKVPPSKIVWAKDGEGYAGDLRQEGTEIFL